jgi:hypothetical protein
MQFLDYDLRNLDRNSLKREQVLQDFHLEHVNITKIEETCTEG